MAGNGSQFDIEYNIKNNQLVTSLQEANAEIANLSQGIDAIQNKLSGGGTIRASDVANWRKAEESARNLARYTQQQGNTQFFGGAPSSALNSSSLGGADISRQLQSTINQLSREFSNQFKGMSIRTNSAYSGRVRNGQTGGDFLKEMDNRRFDRQSNDSSREQMAEYRNIMNSMTRYSNVVNSHGGVISSVDYSNLNRTRERAQNALTDSQGNSRLGQLEASRSNIRDEISSSVENVTKNYGNDKDLNATQQKEKAEALEGIRLLEKRNEFLSRQISSLRDLEQQFGQYNQDAEQIKRVTPNRQSGVFQAYNAVAGGVRNSASQGMSMYYQNMPNARNLAAAQGSYDSQTIRRNADAAGNKYGLSGSEMMDYQSQYISGAGYQSDEDVARAGVSTGLLGRQTGATPQEAGALTSAYAQNVNGANSVSLSGIQAAFQGGLQASGMTKNGSEQLKALTSLTTSVARNNGGSLSQSQAEGLAATQAAFAATNNKAFQGQAGADLLSSMDSTFRDTSNLNNQASLMLYDPDKYAGVQGYVNAVNTMQDGIANPDNQRAAVNEATMYANQFGGDMGMATQRLNDKFGKGTFNRESASDFIDMVNSGESLSSEDLKKLGVSESEEKNTAQQSGQDAKMDKFDASVETASAKLANMQMGLMTTVGGLLQFNSDLLLVSRSLAGLAPRVAQGVAGNVASTGAIGGTGGSGGMGSKIKNSKFGKAVGGSKIAGSLGKLGTSVATSRAGKFVGKLGSSGLARGAGLAGTALSALTLAPELLSDDTNENKGNMTGSVVGGGAGAAIGATLGSVVPGIGTAIGGTIGGIIGGGIGSMAGGTIGGGVGSLFDNGNQVKNEDANAARRASTEEKRAQNNKDEESIISKRDNNLSKGSGGNGGGGSSRESSDSDAKSPFQEYLDNANKGSVRNNGQTNNEVKVVLSGNVTHSGEVADMSNVNASIETIGSSVIEQMFSSPLSTNETTRI